MATLEWAPPIPFSFETDFGTLLINQDLGGGKMFKLNAENCVSRRGIRAQTDPLPQKDGEQFHERWSLGYEMQFAVQLWQASDQIACDVVLCEMRDELYGHIWSLLRPVDDGGRVFWTPSCGDTRLLDAVRLLSLQDPREGDKGVTEITFVLDSPFPYAIDFTQITTHITGTTAISNDGNVPFYPVFKVNGATSGFTLSNLTTGKSLTYDSSLPGASSISGGDYVEIDTFRDTMYRNGNLNNLKPGLDVFTSEFWTLDPGSNSVQITGANVDVLHQAAWA